MLKAGAAQTDVSPLFPMFLFGYPHTPRMSTGVHDPLRAAALCLSDGRTDLLLIGVDILFVGAQTAARCRAAIEAQTGILAAHILISATHTHSGPVTTDHIAFRSDPVVPAALDTTYMAWFEDRIVTAGVEAWKHRADAELAVTTARIAGVGTNRLSPDGPADPEAGILVARRVADGTPIAVQVVYSMHPTVLHEDSTLVSGDFAGLAMQRLAQEWPGVVPLYHTGPSGNQSPRYCVKGQTFEEAERLGGLLAAPVIEAVRALKPGDFQRDVPLAAARTTVELEPRQFMSAADVEANLAAKVAEFERLKREGAPHGPVRTAECTVFGAEELVTLARAQETGELRALQARWSRAELMAFRVGPACLAALPGEVFVEYGLDIKSRAALKTFVISLANGELQGYIVTPEAELAGGYEAQCGFFTAASGPRLTDAMTALIGKLA